MKIEYVCHSCVYLETTDTNLIFDPWFNGAAYLNQWVVFPKPLNTSMVKDVKNILITHGHEDHLHENTLKLFSKNANVYYPFQWRKGAKKYFNTIGYSSLTEAVSFRAYQLSASTKITYISFALESVVVIEFDNIVLLNINDALNSHHQNVVEMFLKEIKKHWPTINYLFAGWAGAGYFPNTVHYKNKNDIEVGTLREQYFANQLCKIIFDLNPKNVIPFLPGFALVHPDKLWINDIKFARKNIELYYKKFFDSKSNINFYCMQPSDVIDDNQFKPISAYHQKEVNGELNHLLQEQYSNELLAATKFNFINDYDMQMLLRRLLKLINDNQDIYAKAIVNSLFFSILIRDRKENNIINICYYGFGFTGSVSSNISPDSLLCISTWSNLLNHSIDNEWGGDVLTIGYGIDVDVYEETTLELNLDIVCVRLISRFPRTKSEIKKNPLRVLKYYYNNPMLAQLAVKQKMTLRNSVNKFPYNERDHWITYTKCELCMVCNMPLLSYDLGQSLQPIETNLN